MTHDELEHVVSELAKSIQAISEHMLDNARYEAQFSRERVALLEQQAEVIRGNHVAMDDLRIRIERVEDTITKIGQIATEWR